MEPHETPVAAVRHVGRNAVAIELETPAGFDAAPGQFLRLTTTVDGDDVSRFYTVSSPQPAGTIEITVEYDPDDGGSFSESLLELSVGDAVTVAGPFGTNYYAGEGRAVVLAGGPGIGPAVAIAERALAEGADAAVVYRDADTIHEDRLAALATAGATVYVLGEGEPLSAAVEGVLMGGADEQVFVYGFADFLVDAESAIAAAGGDPEAAKAEDFG